MTTTGPAPVEQTIELNYYSGVGELMGFLTMVDRLRSAGSFYWSTFAQGFWVLTGMEGIREALQSPDVFSNRAVVATDPEPEYVWIPEMLDPPQHTKWRQLLAPVFSPARMADMEDKVRARAAEIIDRFAHQGRCDGKKDFAEPYPT